MSDERFSDGKDDGALRTIGEVAKALDIKPHVLRYWEQQFPQLDPLKRTGGRRYYRPDDIAMIERINRLVNSEGYTLKGAASVLDSGDETAATDSAVSDGRTKETSSDVASEPVPELAGNRAGTVAADEPAKSAVIPADTIAQLKSIRTSLSAALER